VSAATHWLGQAHVQLALALWCATGLGVGTLVGWWRNRLLLGAATGIVLGPLGWWLTWIAAARVRDCPACSRAIRVQATQCRHCGAHVRAIDERSARSSLKGSMTGTRRPW
jgi:hypothetical protein